ncbi:MAG: hypothetical protein EKK55_23580 [Rhodocyclaceae bacterium]|nr:MAG: hypothetical protein EKK55_23580 [Rhodocyclaceae bacterium]
MSGPPDSRPPRRGKRPPSISDTIDEADERAQAAAAVIERDVRDGLAVERPTMATPRTRTPAEAALRAAIDELRRLQPEWHVAEQTARALDQLAEVIEQERTDRLAADAKKKHAADLETARQSWRAPVWRAVKALAAAAALALGTVTVNALIGHGDSRRAAAQQAEVIRTHGLQLEAYAAALELERTKRADADALLREAIAADHAVLSLFASRAGIPAPFPLHP